MPPPVRIGLIGSGYIARCHVAGYYGVRASFPEAAAHPQFELLAEATEPLARAAAERFGFPRWTADWRRLVEDPAVDLVDICVPSHLHREIALAAIAAGKHLYAEKPVGLNSGEAGEIAQAAAAAGTVNIVGYSYLSNPLVGLAKRLIDEGRLGTIIHFRGAHNEDYLADPKAAHSWRCDPAFGGRAGALGDLGGHIVSIARHLVGNFSRVCGTVRTVVPERPGLDGRMRPVGNDDEAQFLVEFGNGATGHIETSRIATGSKMDITYEITGTRGAIAFDGERMNELQVYTADQPRELQGFARVYAGPAHPPFGNFVPATGHGLSFNDQKTIEIARLMDGIGAGRPAWPDLGEAWAIGRILDAVLTSSAERRWVDVM